MNHVSPVWRRSCLGRQRGTPSDGPVHTRHRTHTAGRTANPARCIPARRPLRPAPPRRRPSLLPGRNARQGRQPVGTGQGRNRHNRVQGHRPRQRHPRCSSARTATSAGPPPPPIPALSPPNGHWHSASGLMRPAYDGDRKSDKSRIRCSLVIAMLWPTEWPDLTRCDQDRWARQGVRRETDGAALEPGGSLVREAQGRHARRPCRSVAQARTGSVPGEGEPQDGTGRCPAGRDSCSAVVAEPAADAVTHGRVPGRNFRLALVVTDAVLRVQVTDTWGDRAPATGSRKVAGASLSFREAPTGRAAGHRPGATPFTARAKARVVGEA